MTRQYICTDVKFAALLAHMGYKFRVAKDPLGTQFIFEDSDITTSGVIDDYENGAQVASAKDLMLMYDTFLEQMGTPVQKPTGTGIELLPMTIPTQEGHDWKTKDFNTATLLAYRGNELIHAYDENGRALFVFSYDDGLSEAVSLYNRKKLRVEPAAWIEAGFAIRNAMREVKGFTTSNHNPRTQYEQRRTGDDK